ncbi:hypothetical protein BDN67DRAFT_481165 [Paxillus ammoniavirescens]|nr:hypothetical protein BDN67DRAFT_481165 [Paxillus ammoniavirescens]
MDILPQILKGGKWSIESRPTVKELHTLLYPHCYHASVCCKHNVDCFGTVNLSLMERCCRFNVVAVECQPAAKCIQGTLFRAPTFQSYTECYSLHVQSQRDSITVVVWIIPKQFFLVRLGESFLPKRQVSTELISPGPATTSTTARSSPDLL